MNYFEHKEFRLKIRIETMLLQMPTLCRLFFTNKEQKSSIRTLERYSYTIKQFFIFLTDKIEIFKNTTPQDFDLIDLTLVEESHIEKFKNSFIKDNTLATVGEKVYTINTFFIFFCKIGEIKENPAQYVEAPKRPDRPIIKLTLNEAKTLFNCVNNETRAKHGLRKVNEKLLIRDKTILTMFLLTGIRISELVGLDIQDIDFDNNKFQVKSKGGKFEFIYMNNELIEQLKFHINQQDYLPNDPVFKSFTNQRINTKNVEEMVKQYSKWAGITKQVTPHTLRKTFGTNIYNITKDVFLAQKLLRHKYTETTTKYYVDIDEDIKRNALSNFSLLK